MADKNLNFKLNRISNEFVDEGCESWHNVISAILPFTIYLIGIVATLETFLSYFKPQINRGPLYLIIIMVAVVNYLIFYVKKHSLYIAIAYVLCFVVAGITSKIEVVNSVVKMLNEIMVALEQNGRYELIRFRYLNSTNEPQLSYSIVVVAILIATIIGIGIFYNRIIYAAAIVLPASLYGTFFDAMPNTIWLGITMVFLASLLVMNRERLISKWCKSWLEATLVIGIPLILMSLIITDKNFKRMEVFEKLDVIVNDVADEISDVLGWKLLSGKKEEVDLGVGGGMLTNLDLSNAKGGIAFNLTTSKPATNLYLKSYVGTVYRNNTWEKWESVNYSISRSSINSYNQSYYIRDAITDLYNYRPVDKKRLWVSTKDKTTFYYLPYGSDYDGAMGYWDTYPVNPPRGYSFNFYATDGSDYENYKTFIDTYDGNNSDILTYINWEKQYRKFVYDNYTIVTNDVLYGLKIPFDYRKKRTYDEVDEYIQEIKEYLATFEYTLSPPELPENTDYVRFFLGDSHKGYCVNFASAGALLLKYAGIPARYVEGFCINPSDISNGSEVGIYNGEKEYNVDVEAKNAHSWVEIYKDGYGWVPVEFTVGYYAGGSGQAPTAVNPQQPTVQENPTIGESQEVSEESEEMTDEDTSEVPIEGKEPENAEDNSILVWLVPVLFLVFVFLFIIIRYFIKVAKLSKLLSCKAVNKEKFYELFYYMELLMNANGLIRYDWVDYSTFEKEVYNKLECFTKDEFHDIMELVLKARFSEDEFENDWYEELLSAVLKVRRETYSKASVFGKFMLHVIKVY